MLARVRRIDLIATALLAWTLVEPWALDVRDARLEVATGVLVVAPLFARRHRAAAAGAAALAAILVQQALGVGGPPVHAPLAAALVAGYALGGVASRRVALGLLPAAACLSGAVVLAPEPQAFMSLAGVVLGGFAIAFFPERRARTAAALREEVRALERHVAEDVRAAAEDERTVIARELERLVEGVAARTRSLRGTAASDRARATAILKETETAARDAIEELRRFLVALDRPAEAPVPPGRSVAARVVRFHARYGPVIAFAVIGVVDQVLLPARPTEVDPGVLVPAAPYPLAVALALALVTPLPLLLRDRAPLVAITVIGALLVGRTAVGDLSSLTWSQNAVGVGLAFAAGAFARGRERSLAGLGIAAAATASAWVLEQVPVTAFEWVYLAALLAGAWAGGRRMRPHIADATRSDGELENLRARKAELEEDAALLERRLVAREVHDLVGHGLSLMSIHAAVSAARLERGTEELDVAVRRVRELAVSTEAELTSLLGSLREPRGEPAGTGRLDDLAGLVAEARRHGQPVVLEGGDVEVPPVVARAVVEVAREGLTNARKHAGTARTRVAVSAEAGAVRLEVVNEPGRPLVGAGSQTGLAGLRDRVRHLGGHLEAGPAPGGGWRLAAVLPLSV